MVTTQDQGQTLLTRDQLLAATQRRYAIYEIDGYGRVRIQSLTELERSTYEANTIREDGGRDRSQLVRSKARLIVLCVVDEAGHRVFTDDDTERLMGLDSAITNRLFDVCQKHCGFTDGDLEELLGNSSGSPSGSVSA